MEDEDLAKHATTVMETLDESICSLEKTDYFVDYLQQVGAQHSKIPGFKKEYFWVCSNCSKFGPIKQIIDFCTQLENWEAVSWCGSRNARRSIYGQYWTDLQVDGQIHTWNACERLRKGGQGSKFGQLVWPLTSVNLWVSANYSTMTSDDANWRDLHNLREHLRTLTTFTSRLHANPTNQCVLIIKSIPVNDWKGDWNGIRSCPLIDLLDRQCTCWNDWFECVSANVQTTQLISWLLLLHRLFGIGPFFRKPF